MPRGVQKGNNKAASAKGKKTKLCSDAKNPKVDVNQASQSLSDINHNDLDNKCKQRECGSEN